MKSRFHIISEYIPICLLLCSMAVSANGNISGVVKDKTGEPLAGASVFIEGSSMGASTGIDGDYAIFDVPPGQYSLKCVYIGYQAIEVAITISPNTNIRQDFELSFQVIDGKPVTVTTQAEGQLAAINQQLASITISNIVSSDRIQELPDANATESVGRLPGVSITRNGGEGSTVVIRGMSSESNLVTINGVRMPATEFNNRGHNMSMISSNILEGIELTKAATPDKDADAIGGTVDFRLRKAPDGFKKSIRLQGGYNSLESSYDMFKGAAGLSNRFFKNKLGIQSLINYERTNRSTEQLRGNYTHEDRLLNEGEEFLPALTTSISIIDRHEIRKRLGGTLILDYQLANGSIMMTNFVSMEDRDILNRTTEYNLANNDVQRNIDSPTQNLESWQNSLTGEHKFNWGSIDWAFSHAVSKREHPFDTQWVFSEPSPYTTSVNALEKAETETIQDFLKNDTLKTRLIRGFNIQETQRQRDLTALVNFKFPFTLTRSITGSVKFGGKIRNQNRFYDREDGNLNFLNGAGVSVIRNYNPDWIYTGVAVSMLNFIDYNYNPGKILNDKYLMGASLDVDLLRRVGEGIKDKFLFPAWGDRNDYENRENIAAGYVMTEINLGSQISFIPGVRYEDENTRYTARHAIDRGNQVSSIEDTTATRKEKFWFPMFHLKYKPLDWFDVRLARTLTVSRPSFQQISPKLSDSQDASTVVYGNPNLKSALSTNYDIYLSFYGNKLGLLTIGGFYKEIRDQFYNLSFTTFDPETDGVDPRFDNYRVTQPFNNEFDGTVKGLELDIQTHFWYLPAPFNGMVLRANFARIHSDTRYFSSFVKQVPINVFPFSQSVRVDTSRDGRLIDQSDYIANIAIGYDIGGFSARLSANYQGNTLSSIDRTFPSLDGFTDDRIQWDLSLKQKVMKTMDAYFNLNNFTGQPDKSFIRYQDLSTSQSFYGMTADLGIRYRF